MSKQHEHEHEHEHCGCEHGCGCSCGCGHEEHGGEGIKGDVIKIIAAAVLMAAAISIEYIFTPSPWVCLIIFAVPYLTVGFETLSEAVESLIHGRLFGECFLMSIATIGAFAVGEYAEAVFVMLFFSVGELFEHIASQRSRRSISELGKLRPDTARVERGGEIFTVSPEEVKIGDIIIVEPGERIPLDGVITQGVSSLNTSALTGESLPLDVAEGDSVMSGCINTSGLIKIEVSGEYRDSTVARILRLVEESSENKSHQEKFITRFSRVYTPIVVALAAIIAFIPPLFFGNFSTWVYRALMCLVVSCPCAVAVSVPLTYFSGMGCASKRGILIKGSAALETLASVRVAVFDKTGTLTKGSFTVTDVFPENISESELIKIAAAAESHSNHPIALSLRAACVDDISACDIGEVSELAGFGISAAIDGKTVLCGNAALMEKNNIPYKAHSGAGTVIYVGIDGAYGGCIVISDTVKGESREALAELKRLGIKSVILTGDRQKTAAAIAKEVGADSYRAELLPDGKVAEMQKIAHENSGRIAFTGDGINDAPVLAMADVGIAMGGLGSDAAVEAADIVLTDDRVTRLPEAVKIARKTGLIARQNIIFSLGFKLIVLFLSALGLSNMWLASFADAGVLVLAVLNAARAMKINNISDKKSQH